MSRLHDKVIRKLSNKMQELLNNLITINCHMLECEYCFIDEDDWPDCKKPTTIKDGYLRGFDIKEISNVIDCPYYKLKGDN